MDCVYLIRSWWAVVNIAVNLKGEDFSISSLAERLSVSQSVSLLKKRSAVRDSNTHKHAQRYSAFERRLCNNEDLL